MRLDVNHERVRLGERLVTLITFVGPFTFGKKIINDAQRKNHGTKSKCSFTKIVILFCSCKAISVKSHFDAESVLKD